MKKSKKNSGSPDILTTVRRTIKKHGMLKPGDAVLAGVSGGPDSMALLHILKELSPKIPFQLGVAHLNHSLRGQESDRDEQFVVRFSQKLNLPVFCAKKDVRAYRKKHRLSTEDAARRVRYSFFDDTCKQHGFNKIALGHHMNDNAELILMYLLRGSGISGISGIPPMREEKIIRPLIDVPRAGIEAFLNEHGLPFVTDSSNTDTDYTRNRIRHSLLPRLENEYNPHIVHTLHRMGSILQDENRWMDDLTDRAMDSCMMKSGPQSVQLSTDSLGSLPAALRRRILRKAIEQVKGNLLKITFDHVEQLMEAIKKKDAHKIFDLPDRIRISKTRGVLQISLEPEALRCIPKVKTPASFSYEITGPGTHPVPETGMVFKISEPCVHCPGSRSNHNSGEQPVKTHKEWAEAGQSIAFFDMETISFPLHVRNPLPGDRFTPLGMKGSQKISRFFSNKKIPAEMRHNCPVLLCKNQIIWVAGHRMDNAVRITRQTRRILKAELLLA